MSKVDRALIPDKMLLTIFLNKIRKLPGVQRDVEDFERAQDGSPVKTYRFLVAAMDGYIDRDLRNRFMRQREHELKISTSGRAFAMPSVEDSAPSPQQRTRGRKKKHTGDRNRSSRSGSG